MNPRPLEAENCAEHNYEMLHMKMEMSSNRQYTDNTAELRLSSPNLCPEIRDNTSLADVPKGNYFKKVHFSKEQ